MEEIRIKAYRRLLKHLVDAGRGSLYHKKEIDTERANFMGDYCYLMHNLASANHLDNWDDFHEVYFWETYDFLREKSNSKTHFDSIKAVFTAALNEPDDN